MADKIIAAKLTVDTGSANANIKEVNKNLVDTKENLIDTGKAAKKTGADVEGAGGSFGKLKGSIEGLPGPLGQAGEGVTKLSATFKALIANPVGLVLAAIVLVLTAIYAAFKNTFAGGQKVEQVFAGIGAVGQSLLDNLGKIGSAIKNVFTFNFKGAIKDIKEVGAAAKDAYDKIASLKAQQQKLDIEQAKNDFDQIGRRAKLAQLKEDATNTDLTTAERLKKINELEKESRENAKDDLRLAKERADVAVNQLLVETNGAEKNQIKILEIRGEQKKGEIENANELKQIGRLRNQALREEHAESNTILKERQAAQKEHNVEMVRIAKEQKKINDELQKSFIKQRREQDKTDLDLYNEMVKLDEQKIKAKQKLDEDNEKIRIDAKKKEYDLEKEINAKRIVDEQTVADAKASIQMQSINVIEQGIQVIASVFGKNKTIQKAALIAENAIGVAKIVINTNAANAAARLKYALIPGGAALAAIETTLNKVSAGIGIAASVAATAKGLSALGGGNAGSGGASIPSSGGTSPSAPVSPSLQTTKIDQSQLNQIGSAAVKAYTVESDGANASERIARLNRAARLGG